MLLLPAASSYLYGAIPDGYYDRTHGLSDAELMQALHDIILPHKRISSYQDLPKYFAVTDVYPVTNRWWDMYSDVELYAPSFSGLNREHSFPKSWWGGDTTVDLYTDLHHLYPSEMAANSAKSNYPLGRVQGTPTFDNGVSRVGRGMESGGAAYVFEPADEYKGDFARTYFYVVTAYMGTKWKYTYMTSQDGWPGLRPWAVDLLLEWHRNDPVSSKEKDRNEAVESYQANRNPFIDYPVLAEYLWGDRIGEPFVASAADNPDGPVLLSPGPGTTVDFRETTAGYPAKAALCLKGRNIEGIVRLTISGEDANLFAADSHEVDGSQLDGDGLWVSLTYSPGVTGSHQAVMTLSGANLTEPVNVTLRGAAFDYSPTPAPTALAAIEVDPDCYLARWRPAEGTVADSYVVTVTRCFEDGSTATRTLETDETEIYVEGLLECRYETYTVQSIRRGIISEPSNAITVYNSEGVDGITCDEPLRAECPGGGTLRLRCAGAINDVSVIDMGGREAVRIPRLADGMELRLPRGVYIITTPGRRVPVRAAVR